MRTSVKSYFGFCYMHQSRRVFLLNCAIVRRIPIERLFGTYEISTPQAGRRGQGRQGLATEARWLRLAGGVREPSCATNAAEGKMRPRPPALPSSITSLTTTGSTPKEVPQVNCQASRNEPLPSADQADGRRTAFPVSLPLTRSTIRSAYKSLSPC